MVCTSQCQKEKQVIVHLLSVATHVGVIENNGTPKPEQSCSLVCNLENRSRLPHLPVGLETERCTSCDTARSRHHNDGTDLFVTTVIGVDGRCSWTGEHRLAQFPCRFQSFCRVAFNCPRGQLRFHILHLDMEMF